jgi:serine/threonine protein kinase
VVAEVAANRPGQFICGECRRNPEQLLRNNLDHKQAGHNGFPVIQGYTIRRKLGQGGTGSVWLAHHASSGREVAIKLVLPEVAADQRAVKRALLEIANTRALNHPHVVRLWDVDYANGLFAMILEYCDGGSVSDLIRQHGRALPLDVAMTITLQTLEGLHYAHNISGPGKGLVHRDLKPANLFLSGTGKAQIAKVGDYGLAKAFDNAGLSGGTRTGEAAGTPAFMPRQQVLAFKDVGPEVDVWAVAASLYYMLTGSTPRDFVHGSDPWLTVLETDPLPIRNRKPWLPASLGEVIDLALRDEPDIHFKTALELKAALLKVCPQIQR